MPKVASDAERIASQLRGMAAGMELDVAKPLLGARKEQLISTAIARYQSTVGEYTPLDALLFVAALVENQRLLNDLEHVERQGRRAGEALLKQ